MVLALYFNCFIWQWKDIHNASTIGAVSESSCCWLISRDGTIVDLGFEADTWPHNQSYDLSIDCKKGLLIPGLNGKYMKMTAGRSDLCSL